MKKIIMVSIRKINKTCILIPNMMKKITSNRWFSSHLMVDTMFKVEPFNRQNQLYFNFWATINLSLKPSTNFKPILNIWDKVNTYWGISEHARQQKQILIRCLPACKRIIHRFLLEISLIKEGCNLRVMQQIYYFKSIPLVQNNVTCYSQHFLTPLNPTDIFWGIWTR